MFVRVCVSGTGLRLGCAGGVLGVCATGPQCRNSHGSQGNVEVLSACAAAAAGEVVRI